MYQHILLAVALQQWDGVQPTCRGGLRSRRCPGPRVSAQLSVLSVYDYDDKQPEALSLSPRR